MRVYLIRPTPSKPNVQYFNPLYNVRVLLTLRLRVGSSVLGVVPLLGLKTRECESVDKHCRP